MIVDRDPAGLDAPDVCRALRDDPRLGDAWLLAITVPPGPDRRRRARRRRRRLPAPPVHPRRAVARARAGLRAAQQRANDRLLRALMDNVPGAIYRSAWHAGTGSR